MELLQEPKIWVTIGFLLLVFLLFRRFVRLVVGALDAHTETIRRQLEEAASLRQEAEESLTKAEKKLSTLRYETDQILSAAHREVEILRHKSDRETADTMRRRREAARERILHAERRVVAELQHKASKLALLSAQTILIGKLSGSGQFVDDFIDKATKEIPNLLRAV